ncbi:hypothetical protein CU098_004296 [Rhizopus stolonifer]|uniref:PH domain-containing protein n=1 Tax=Rhizopus stolonifer TaxID=4846 RepID=A0A367J4S9_RHIST|nr:hypothetical protein CU098_004296 [Rhizopus stolonifer]
MTHNLNHMLRNLEKQVNNFALTMNDSTNQVSLDKRYHSNNSDNVPLQHYKSRAIPSRHDNSIAICDDDVCIGTILQRSATARRPQPEKPPTLSHSRSLRTNHTKEPVSQEDQELTLVMQRAWAVLDANHDKNQVEPEEPAHMVSTARIHTVPLKTLTTRIYIDDAKNHKVVQLTNLLTTAMVVQYLKKKGLLDTSEDWTLFEIDNKRPLREWEVVIDVLSVWEPDASNALLVKKYSYHYSLISECILQQKTPSMHGWLSIEYKKNKWQRRYCFIKDGAIHHAKDNNKSTSSSILCYLATYDVYTLLQSPKASPTPYVIAIRAQDRPSIFENENDFMRFLAAENQEEMKDWVLSIRSAKSIVQYQQYPNRVANPLAHISLENAVDEKSTVRRHKSTKETTKPTEEPKHVSSLSRSESSRRGGDEKRPLGRNATTRGLSRNNSNENNDGPLIDCFDVPTFSKGSLLAKEEQQEQILYRQQESQEQEETNTSKTLIQVEDRVTFAKGSLLDQKEPSRMTRSKSVREASSATETGEHRRHASLRRKTTARRHHDVPLPNNAAIASIPTTGLNSPKPTSKTALLQLDDTPESFHTKELHGRHVKPLISFDANEKFSRKL